MTAYWSGMAEKSLSEQFVAGANVQVRVMTRMSVSRLIFAGKRGVGGCHSHDALGRSVENRLSGGTLHFDRSRLPSDLIDTLSTRLP